MSTNASTFNITKNIQLDAAFNSSLTVIQESVTNICHPKLICDFKNEIAVYPDHEEFDQLNEIDYNRHITKLSHDIGDDFTMSKGGNMNRYFI